MIETTLNQCAAPRAGAANGGSAGRRRLAGAACLVFALLAASSLHAATSVSLGARMGDKAVLVINGKSRAMSVGSNELGVRLLNLTSDGAVVEVDGQRVNLRLGGTPIDLGSDATPRSGGSKIVLSMGSGGHFTSSGSINGRPVQFMVDTGASVVSMSQAEAERIGLKYQKAPRAQVQTANGIVPVHMVRLGNVRVGDVLVYDVDAVVLPAQLQHVLLGNSFLSRFQMHRDNNTMTLEKRN